MHFIREVVHLLQSAWIVPGMLLLAACGGASPPTADDGFRVSANIAAAPGNGGGKGSGKGGRAERLARAANATKTLDTGCPSEMAPVDQPAGRFCIDRWEASVVEIDPVTGEEHPHSPFYAVGNATVRAVSRPGVLPQGYISAIEASRACAQSGKRLCKPAEWRKACLGPEHKTWGYGDRLEPRRCNDHGRSPILALFGSSTRQRYAWDAMNYPQLNQLEGTLAKTGSHTGCTNGFGVFDMVGNLHEWVADPAGTFFGGYYQDTQQHGDGCAYRTVAHNAAYHDYSTGFRCCAEPGLEL